MITRAACGCLLALALGATAAAQTPASSPNEQSNTDPLQVLSKKIDEQNLKIDTLSQQIQKLEQLLAATRPPSAAETPAPSPAASATPVAEAARPAPGISHTVARGETLTSIARMYKVTIEELQKTNHITDDRKLQIGQTLTIPATPAPSVSPSATAAPRN